MKQPLKFIKIAYVFLLVIISIVILEYVSGYLWENLSNKYDNGKKIVEELSGLKGTISARIRQHPYLFYELVPNYYDGGLKQHNSMGYRNEEFSAEKAPDAIRILVLGGSTTYMYPYVMDMKDTWVSILEDMLNTYISNNKIHKKVEVINCGLGNATSAELLAAYVFRHQWLDPDVIILHTGGNDIAPLLFDGYNPEYTHIRSTGGGREPRKLERSLLRASNIAKLVYTIWLNNYPGVYKPIPMYWKQLSREKAYENAVNNYPLGFERNIDTIIRLAKEKEIKIILYGFLQKDEDELFDNMPNLQGLEKAFTLGLKKNYEVMKKIASIHNVAFVAPQSNMFDSRMFLDNCHLNEEGERVKASIIYDYIIKNREKYIEEQTAN